MKPEMAPPKVEAPLNPARGLMGLRAHGGWQDYKEFIRDETEKLTKVLEQQTDPTLLFRAQGGVAALKRIGDIDKKISELIKHYEQKR